MADGELLFVVEIPPEFDRAVDRGESPSVLVDADATDPSAIGNATAALTSLVADLQRDLPSIRQNPPQTAPFQFVIHARYNPERLTVLNIVPGLVCMILIFSTLFATTLSITKERERGTMENLLAMPVRPLEVMLAKIMPYLVVGYAQLALVLITSSLFFRHAHSRLDSAAAVRARAVHGRQSGAGGHFLDNCEQSDAGDTDGAIHADAILPAVGIHVSVPRHALMGAMGRRVLPTTHAVRIVRGIMLKGNGWTEIAPDLWPLALFMSSSSPSRSGFIARRWTELMTLVATMDHEVTTICLVLPRWRSTASTFSRLRFGGSRLPGQRE